MTAVVVEPRTSWAPAPPHSVEAEEAVLGAVLLVGSTLDVLLVEEGLRAAHFYGAARRAVFEAMVGAHDAGRAIDVLTIADRLDAAGQLAEVGGAQAVDRLAGCAPAAGNVREYARIVVDRAMWRARQASALDMLRAIGDRDEPAFGTAEASLSRADRPDETTSTADELASEVWDYLAHDGDDDAIKLPFATLNRLLAGGLRAGDVTLIAGWTSMGKSCLADGILEHAAGTGVRCHAYTNEMSKRDKTLRTVASLSGVPFERQLARTLTASERARAVAGLGEFARLGVGVTECSGWSAQDIARHIRRHRWELAVVDLVHLIPYRDVRELDAISATLNNAARQSGCHLLLVCQLNSARNLSADLPRPVKRDVRGTAMLVNDAANVLMVHRDQEEVTIGGIGVGVWETLSAGSVYLEKARNGTIGGVRVSLDPARMRFVETDLPPMAVFGA